ncbi:hypothetical protein M0R19_03935 [Candidatus Pacearchaeota archaeon]|jgi:hypothetical protein|nr:hypothetical protein [Candidatus Pacearchaeota archaeon]
MKNEKCQIDYNNVVCDKINCRFWINFKEDNNCCFCSINKYKELTLREIGERLNLSHVSIHKLERKALHKVTLKLKNNYSFQE